MALELFSFPEKFVIKTLLIKLTKNEKNGSTRKYLN